MNRISLVAAALIAAPANAQTYDFSIDQPNSSFSAPASFVAPSVGSLIGNYDAVENPGGTQTRAGISGGSGNNPIALDLTVSASTNAATQPDGSFRFVADTEALTASMSGLVLSMLGEDSIELPITATLNWDTFHTVNPGAIFFGGFDIPIPVGSVVITGLTATQSGEAAGVLVPAGDDYTFVILVPVDVVGQAEVLGQVLDLPATPFVLALAGTLSIGDNSATITIVADADIQQTIPGPIPGPENQPLDVPTILPPGFTAHLLITTEFTQVDFTLGLHADIVANGTPVCAADLNGDGQLNAFDFLSFQTAFSNEDPAADLAAPAGIFNIFDFLAFQTAFGNGC